MTDHLHVDGPCTLIQWTVHFRMDPLIKASLSVTQFFVTNNLSNDFKIIERLETLALPEMQSNHQFGIEFRTL